MQTVDTEVAGGAYRVRTWRSGSGPTVLYLHGFDGPLPDDSPLERLAASRTVLAPEHPGFGESTGFEHIDEMLDMVLYYRQFVEEVAGEPIDVIGHSLGGMFAAEFAALCPQLVKRVVLVAPFGLWLDETPMPDLFVMSPSQLQRAMWNDPESHVAQSALSNAGNGKSGPAAVVARAMNLSAAGKFLWPIPDRGLRKRLPLIKASTLVIAGEADRLVPSAYADAFGALIPGARVQTIPGAGHMPMLEQPDTFHRLVTEFLAG